MVHSPSFLQSPAIFFWSLMLFSLLGRGGGEFYTSHLSVFSPLPFVGITSLGDIPIPLNGFQMGIHHLWSSIVGYWAKITFLYFLRVFIGNWHAEHFCQTTWFRCKLNPENSGKDITRTFAIECDIIHLFPLQKGDMKICSPEKSHISRRKYDYFEGEQISISPLCKWNECFIPPGQRFGQFCQMKSFVKM
jgi:hypothetical protein